MRIHDPATDDIDVPTPTGWPSINVSAFQLAFSIDDKTSSSDLVNKLKMAIKEVVENFNPELVTLPLEDPETVYFAEAVHNLAFAKLLPYLPVNRQHKSDPEEVDDIKNRVKMYEKISLDNQKQIVGFVRKIKTSLFTSELL